MYYFIKNAANLLRVLPTVEEIFSHSKSFLLINITEGLSLVCALQFLPTEHQFCTRLVVKLRGDIEALGLGQLVARHLTCAAIRLGDGSGCQRKIAPTYFLPRRLHVSDSLEYVFVLFTCQLGNLERRHCLFTLFFLNNINNVCHSLAKLALMKYTITFAPEAKASHKVSDTLCTKSRQKVNW